MSLKSRREYLAIMRGRYHAAKTRDEKSLILDEVERTCDYNRKYAIRVLCALTPAARPAKIRRKRSRRYQEALPAIQLAWEALDYACAERLHPVLFQTVAQLLAHGELSVNPEIRRQLSAISRATLARRLAEMPTPKPRRMLSRPTPSSLIRSEVPLGRYAWDEDRPGAIEIDLVEHNGGSSTGHFAYTLSVVDIVSGWSRRRAVLGRGQTGIHQALQLLLTEWPFRPWGLHSDNGSEFLNHQLLRFAKAHDFKFTRSRPYRKNDNAHVEQRNRQFVRDVVGYTRYDTPQQVDWLNQVYAYLDPYANLVLPTRKIVEKTRHGSHVRKRYDTAKTPFDRLCVAGILSDHTMTALREHIQNQNPLALRRRLEQLTTTAPSNATSLDLAAD